jgi:hypothetical protein
MASSVLCSLLLGVFFSVGAAAQGTNFPAANHSFPWQNSAEVFVLPVAADPLQAARFYAVLPDSSHEG